MSDYNSSLPIRTETAGDVIIKVADATVPSQQLTVEADGSINVNAAFAPGTEVKITDGTDTVAVNADGSLNVVATATDLDIRNLVFATDKVDASGTTLGANSGVDIGDVTINNASGAAAVNIQDGGNTITVDGTVELGATTLAALESITVQNGAGASAVNIQDGGNSLTVDGTVELGATTLAALESITVQNGAGASAVNIQDGGNSLTVDATDLDIRDLTHVTDSVKIGDGTDLLAINTDGSINVVISNDVPGTEICNRTTSASVASAASVNHDYTVTAAKTFTAEQVVVAGSGKIKVQVLFNGAIKFDAFNSTANPTIIIPMLRLIKAAATQVVRITITNLDNQAQDVYSTLMGEETP